MISEAGTNAGENNLERKMVASGASVTCRIHSYTTYEEVICMLNSGKCKELMIVATGDLQLEIFTSGIGR